MRVMQHRWPVEVGVDVLILDNRDSFPFNLAHRLNECGATCSVVRSEDTNLQAIREAKPASIVISPGPGHPKDAHLSLEVVRQLSGEIPILGVCLGHQVIAEALGGTVIANGHPRHGKTSPIHHDERGLFQDMPNPSAFARYHSLSVAEMPAVLRTTAWTDDIVMAFQHDNHLTFGVQFHPESVLSPQGFLLLRNFLGLVRSNQ